LGVIATQNLPEETANSDLGPSPRLLETIKNQVPGEEAWNSRRVRWESMADDLVLEVTAFLELRSSLSDTCLRMPATLSCHFPFSSIQRPLGLLYWYLFATFIC
jgi:hypothetical protein